MDGISFNIADGETFGLVGESGAARRRREACIEVDRATEGKVIFNSIDVLKLNKKGTEKASASNADHLPRPGVVSAPPHENW